jgi:NADH dehydrogenase (ubiquinone) 1 alpha subcomplex subunit 9
MSNSGITATVFGGYGFLGRYLINELGLCGSRVYLPFRGCELEVRHLKPMFDQGQLGLLPFSPRDEESIIKSLQNSDVVVNMIGKYYETKHIVPTRRADGSLSRINYSFEDVHVNIPANIARLAKKAGVKTFIHVSALAGSATSASAWSRSKFHGEAAVKKEFPEAIIVRPATVFGPEDRFLNLIGEAAKRLPFYALINGGSTSLQPVYCVDVGKALMSIVRNHTSFEGKTFELVGPAEYSYKEAVELVADITGNDKPLVDVPIAVANLVSSILDQTIQPIITTDEIIQMTEDVLPSKANGILTLADVGIEPAAMDNHAFEYIHRFRSGGHFQLVQGYH